MYNLEKRILVFTNSINGLYSFRKELVEELLSKGYKVTISAPQGAKGSYFCSIGCSLVETVISRRGMNPINDLKLLLHYIALIKKVCPDVVLTYTVKPNVYGGMACRITRTPYIANVTGLGTSIENGGVLSNIALSLYRIGLKKAACIFFQNDVNKQFFAKKRLVSGKTRLIPGSGVNLNYHSYEKYPRDGEIINFLFIGRIMRNKGIEELFEAAETIINKYTNIQFHLIGNCEENYSERLEILEECGIIIWHGVQEDVRPYIRSCHALINPSYHEGMSNVLLEAASTGRPVLASNVPGCRETFDEGKSGYEFKVKNTESLVDAIEKFIKLSHIEKEQMGLAGRAKAEGQFDRQLVVNTYIEIIDSIVCNS